MPDREAMKQIFLPDRFREEITKLWYLPASFLASPIHCDLVLNHDPLSLGFYPAAAIVLQIGAKFTNMHACQDNMLTTYSKTNSSFLTT